MGDRGFRNLVVWQKAKDLSVMIYKTTQDGAISRDFGLRDQIRRSSVSIPSNIAEGDERDTDKEAVRFFYIAKGSLAELQTQIQIAYETGSLNIKNYEHIDSECAALGKMIGKLIKVRKQAIDDRR